LLEGQRGAEVLQNSSREGEPNPGSLFILRRTRKGGRTSRSGDSEAATKGKRTVERGNLIGNNVLWGGGEKVSVMCKSWESAVFHKGGGHMRRWGVSPIKKIFLQTGKGEGEGRFTEKAIDRERSYAA